MHELGPRGVVGWLVELDEVHLQLVLTCESVGKRSSARHLHLTQAIHRYLEVRSFPFLSVC